MSSGAVTLGQVARRLARLEISCSKCGRQGSYSVRRLVDWHGPDLGLPDLTAKLSADCPHRRALTYARCQVYFPDLEKKAGEE
jgi:hypothetical protein